MLWLLILWHLLLLTPHCYHINMLYPNTLGRNCKKLAIRNWIDSNYNQLEELRNQLQLPVKSLVFCFMEAAYKFSRIVPTYPCQRIIKINTLGFSSHHINMLIWGARRDCGFSNGVMMQFKARLTGPWDACNDWLQVATRDVQENMRSLGTGMIG